MEMVLIVLGVLVVMFVIDRQRHERDLRMRAARIRDEHTRSRRGGRPDA